MNKLQQVHVDLEGLVSIIETLPEEIQVTLHGALNQLNNTMNNRKLKLDLTINALSQLRLDVKYLVFDLESTRQERDEYKQQLEK